MEQQPTRLEHILLSKSELALPVSCQLHLLHRAPCGKYPTSLDLDAPRSYILSWSFCEMGCFPTDILLLSRAVGDGNVLKQLEGKCLDDLCDS